MATIAEILKATGMSDAEIAGLDARVMTAATSVLSTAEQAEKSAREHREAAELADRSQKDLYANKIAPALNDWGNEKARIEAERAYYKTQAESAKAAGFIATDAPGYVAPPAGDPTRAPNGTYIANAGGVPGSPAFMTKEEGFKAVSNATFVISEHMRLYGTPAPDDVETLVAEATQQRMPFRDYAAKKYNFDGKKAEIAAAAQKERDDKIRAEATAERDRYYAERQGSNPMVRPGEQSHYAELRKGIDSKQLKDPLSMSKEERSQQTSALIQKELVDNAAAAVH
jgi:hypothetical protein